MANYIANQANSNINPSSLPTTLEKGDTLTFNVSAMTGNDPSSGSVFTYTIPRTGTYYIEASGAMGTILSQSIPNPKGYQAGKGAKIKVKVQLKKDQELYIIVGRSGKSGSSTNIPSEFTDGVSGAAGGASIIGIKLDDDPSGIYPLNIDYTYHMQPIVISPGGSGSVDYLFYDSYNFTLDTSLPLSSLFNASINIGRLQNKTPVRTLNPALYNIDSGISDHCSYSDMYNASLTNDTIVWSCNGYPSFGVISYDEATMSADNLIDYEIVGTASNGIVSCVSCSYYNENCLISASHNESSDGSVVLTFVDDSLIDIYEDHVEMNVDVKANLNLDVLGDITEKGKNVLLEEDIVTTDSSSNTDKQVPSAKMVYNQLDRKAPKNHASSSTIYGIGSSTSYGHVKLSLSGISWTTGTAEEVKYVSSGSVNLNSSTYMYEGSWIFNNITTATGFPTETWTGTTNSSHLTVLRTDSGISKCIQILVKEASSDIYIRYNTANGTIWSAWQKIYNSGDGDLIQGNNSYYTEDYLDSMTTDGVYQVNIEDHPSIVIVSNTMDGFYQYWFKYGKMYTRHGEYQSDGTTVWSPWLGSVSNSSRSATKIVGISGVHSASDCDYLVTASSAQTVISQAISELPSTGGKVVLLEGNYTLSDILSITKDNVTIEGQGFGTHITGTLNSASSPTGKAIDIKANNITIRNLKLTSTEIDTFSNSDGGSDYDSSNVVIDNIYFEDFGLNGLQAGIESTKNTILSNCFFYRSSEITYPGVALGISFTKSVQIINNNINFESDNYGSSNFSVYVDTSENLMFSGNTIITQSNAMEIMSDSSGKVHNNNITAAYSSNTMAIEVNECSDNVIIDSNTIRSYFNSSNQSYDSKTYNLIKCINSSAIITNNDLTIPDSSLPAIDIFANSDTSLNCNVDIVGNIIRIGEGKTGIRIQGASGTPRGYIANNLISGGDSSSDILMPGGISQPFSIFNNILYDVNFDDGYDYSSLDIRDNIYGSGRRDPVKEVRIGDASSGIILKYVDGNFVTEKYSN